MNTLVVPKFTLRESRLVQFFHSAYQGSTTLSLHALAMLIGFAICFWLQSVDAREFNGANVWMKPGKFFLSFSVQLFTIAWALSLIEEKHRRTRVIFWANWTLIVAAWYELIYITFRASRVEASHFNLETPLSAALYALMAWASVLLVVPPAIVGWKILKANPKNIWNYSIAIGFTLAAVTTMIVGFTLGGNTSHWIGGDLTDATGLPIFKWSTTGGDLRVAHFIGLHAMQIVPFAALSGKRSVVWGVAIVVTIATALTYFQALGGVPLLRL